MPLILLRPGGRAAKLHQTFHCFLDRLTNCKLYYYFISRAVVHFGIPVCSSRSVTDGRTDMFRKTQFTKRIDITFCGGDGSAIFIHLRRHKTGASGSAAASECAQRYNTRRVDRSWTCVCVRSVNYYFPCNRAPVGCLQADLSCEERNNKMIILLIIFSHKF